MVQVRFTQTRTVQDGTGTTFEAGRVYDLPRVSADRWIRRGVAEEVAGEADQQGSTDTPPHMPMGEATPEDAPATFDPTTADLDALRAFLKAREVKFHHLTGEAKLREMAAEVLKG